MWNIRTRVINYEKEEQRMEFSALSLLYDVAWMSALMLVAKVIRSKVRFIRACETFSVK